MSRGQKANDDIKEKAFALLAVNNSYSAVARELEIPRSTLMSWVKKREEMAKKGNVDSLAKLRQEKKEEFIAKSWDSITTAQSLIERRLKRALDSEEKIDKLLEVVAKEDEKVLNQAQKNNIYKMLFSIRVEDLGKLATVLGTLYDKQALACKEETTIIGGTVAFKKFEDF